MRVRKKKNCDIRLEKSGSLWIKNPEMLKGKWHGEFGNQNPIHIEIGCGKGKFICEMAEKYPDINFVAIEVVKDVMVIAMEKAEPLGLSNLRFIIADASGLSDYFEKGEVERIYLNFSDPWKKRKQAKRRLTHKNFLDVYKKVLKNGDLICFKTDNKALFEFSLNSFAEENFKMSQICFDLHNSDFEDNVMTEYEMRFSEQGMPIYRVCATFIGWEDQKNT
ncbi:MAG TPA: tRNA (guanosine(46)-N7)-methyltransferase TrmB [Clostridiales bacterium]|nr:tRNA (guanosine(46)-N7)-methyltransferase TrmB [Clostridiales bacterium]